MLSLSRLSLSGLATTFARAGLVLALGAVLLPDPGYTQTAKAQKKHAFAGFSSDRSKPIEIESDELELIEAQKLGIFRGKVIVRQNGGELQTKVLKVYYSGSGPVNGSISGGQDISKIVAEGKVYARSDDQEATGDHAVVDMRTEIIVLTGNVVLTKGKNVLQGDKLTVNMKTGQSKLVSKAKSGGRVRGVFQPQSAKTKK